MTRTAAGPHPREALGDRPRIAGPGYGPKRTGGRGLPSPPPVPYSAGTAGRGTWPTFGTGVPPAGPGNAQN